MSLFRLAMGNFKRSVREFGVLVLSLSFSVFIFFNFQNVIYSQAMDVLMEFRKDLIDSVIQAASVVFAVFLFFFIWYATNVFLNQRKKEIGIYIFMGLDNKRISRMYALESTMVGLFSLIFGLAFGVLFSKLFQMLLLKLSEISVDVEFSFSLRPVLNTGGMFLVIYGLMILKGCHTLKNSSVLNLLSGARQKEIRQENKVITALRILAGTAALILGYLAALDTGGPQGLVRMIQAVVLVILGVYLLYSGLIPAILRLLTRSKNFLYRKERTLWINNLAFRIKKNYRTYAMVTVLMICSVTLMALAIALKQRYDRMENFDQVYSCQVVNYDGTLDGEEILKGIEGENPVEYWNEYTLLNLPSEMFHTKYNQTMYVLVPYSQVKEGAGRAGLEFPYKELEDDQVVGLSHEILFSLAGTNEPSAVNIGEKTYDEVDVTTTPYLGKLQTYTEAYIVSDRTFEELKSRGSLLYIYNYRLENPGNIEASRPWLQDLVQGGEEGMTGVSYTEDSLNEDSYIRVTYSLCLFMFVTLMLAAGSIIFLKIGNEAYEDGERYEILEKMGVPRKTLGKAVRNEICFAYYCPFLLMSISSYFSVRALGELMKEDLFRINVWSALFVLVLFSL
ncbi:MAG: ABC transporter permease, partial [Clostridiales bacterium]|nr:ABC transporter permease [Clostridiales bacterium]